VSRLTRELTRDQEVFTRLIVNGARATGAIAERRDDFAALVRNGEAFAAAIAAENSSFDQALAALPSTLRNGTAAFNSLTRTIPALNELTNVSKPAIKGLPEYLNSLGTLFATMQRPFEDLSAIVRTPGPGNDATDTLEQMPSLQRQARTSVSNQIKALKRGQPIVEFFRPYAPDLAAWITHFSQVPAYYDANGNYARVLPIFNAFDYDGSTNTVNALSPANRKTDLSSVGARWCPGAATQPATDGSNPFLDDGRLGFDDCDPSDIPPP
jgi:phospholipid/cholesterol/gamma-HCH transport system substrate-binding protein